MRDGSNSEVLVPVGQFKKIDCAPAFFGRNLGKNGSGKPLLFLATLHKQYTPRSHLYLEVGVARETK